jgi:hypothetical protein
MELWNQAMTIQNAKGVHWLVSFEHDFGDGEHIVLTVKVLKSANSVLEVEREAFDRATELLQVVSRKIESNK